MGWSEEGRLELGCEEGSKFDFFWDVDLAEDEVKSEFALLRNEA